MASQERTQTAVGQDPPKRGEIIAVCSAKGGVGRTTLTVNTAAAFYKNNRSVGVLDGDYQFGDVSLALDLQSAFTVKEVVEGIENLDPYGLQGYISSHESGVKVLAAPERPEFADLVTKEHTNLILDLMASLYDYVLVDTSVGLSDNTLNFIEKADQVLLVTNLEMATLKNTKLMLETFSVLGLREKVKVIINRSTMQSVILASDAAAILNEEEPIYIPNDFQICSQSLNIGIPFVINQGKSEVAKAVFKMAERISTRREISVPATNNSSSFLSKLLPRKRRKGGRLV
ncbi:AAA family ATPase [Mesobacillus harenae]|uniref:AAA family ATPase n=1 Tax=Mesobacillus harenae TaxID=2213203 RepID=UPI001580F5D4|nr:AAA family ATPase [Mesobacillus harenae]